MKLHAINAGHFKLDGGAMFGVVPKSIWNRLNPADGNNMCSWAMRCLLIESGNRLVLVDNGMGDKQDAKFFGYYYLHGDDTLEKSLRKAGYTSSDITDVVLTHLHFDHCGGSIKRDANGQFVPAFENATYYCNEKHWEWAVHPNAREKASFLKENILPIQESGRLKWLTKDQPFMDDVEFLEVYGHTEAMMLPLVSYKNTKIAYMADLIPSVHHLPLPYVMAYDVRPLETLKEKAAILDRAEKEGWTLMFEHDPTIECATLTRSDKGIHRKDTLKLSEV